MLEKYGASYFGTGNQKSWNATCPRMMASTQEDLADKMKSE